MSCIVWCAVVLIWSGVVGCLAALAVSDSSWSERFLICASSSGMGVHVGVAAVDS